MPHQICTIIALNKKEGGVANRFLPDFIHAMKSFCICFIQKSNPSFFNDNKINRQ